MSGRMAVRVVVRVFGRLAVVMFRRVGVGVVGSEV